MKYKFNKREPKKGEICVLFFGYRDDKDVYGERDMLQYQGNGKWVDQKGKSVKVDNSKIKYYQVAGTDWNQSPMSLNLKKGKSKNVGFKSWYDRVNKI